MRLLRYVFYVVGGLLLLIILAAILIPLFVDINDYKEELAAAVEERTGRELVIEGDLELSVFPWLAVEMGATRLGNARGFGDRPFAAFERAEVGVRLWPLLGKRLEVGNVELHGLQLNLERAADGRTNWDDLTAGEAEAEPPPAEEGTVSLDSIGGIELSNAHVAWTDRQAGTSYTITGWNLDTSALRPGEPFDLRTELVLAGEGYDLKLAAQTRAVYDASAGRLALTSPVIEVELVDGEQRTDVALRVQELAADLEPQRFLASQLRVEAKVVGPDVPGGGIQADVAAEELQADLTAQTLRLKSMVAKALGLELSGEIEGEKIVDEPLFRGPIRVAEFSPRKMLERLGQDFATTDPKALSSAAFSASMRATDTSLALAKLDLTLDQTKLTGTLRIADFAKSALRFDLNVDRIDLDRYMPPSAEDQKAATPAEAAEIPLEQIRALNVAGDLKVGEAMFAGMRFSDVVLGVKAANGKVRVHPSTASFYDGRYQGDIGLDATGNQAVLSLDERVTGIDFAAMTTDLAETDLVRGRANARAKLTARGKDSAALTQTMSGNVDLALADGAIEGFDLWYEIRRARALIEREAVPAAPAPPPRTKFNQFSATARVDNGVARNDDLIIAMDYLRVTGDGVISIVEGTLDYDVKATVLDIPAEGSEPRTEELVDAVIPIKISGTFAEPKVRPDLEGWLKARAKQQIEKKKEEVREKVEEKVKDKLKDLLKRDD